MNPVQKIKDAFKTQNLVLLTGPGGTGKTYTINELCRKISNVARTATTGIAATHIKGETIHRFSSIGIYQDPDSFFRIVNSGFFEETAQRIRESNLIIIDEISMMHKRQFELISKIFAYACYNREIFGGKKILMSGDFLQLPPVDKNGIDSPWIFDSEIWKEANPKIIELKKIYRQENVEFTETLMNIRRGVCTDVDNSRIASREAVEFVDIKPIRFVATNKEINPINMYELNQIPGESKEYTASVIVENSKSPKHKAMLRDQVVKDMIAPEFLHLKVGAQVMILVNGDQYCNGTMAKVVKLKDSCVEVELECGEVVVIEPNEWTKLDNKDKRIASFYQIPLRLAYAITVHKSQGMTLDYCDINFRRFFSPGQAYVALSRVKSLEGLRVLNWDRSKVFADPEALDFYGYPNNVGVDYGN